MIKSKWPWMLSTEGAHMIKFLLPISNCIREQYLNAKIRPFLWSIVSRFGQRESTVYVY